MSDDDIRSKIEQITTSWSVIRDAHGTPDTARAAQELLMRQYGPAVRRYLRKVAGGEEAADELYQEFAVAVVEGKLKSADPGRGRFRDYVKAVLRHLVAKYHGKRRRGPQAIGGRTPLEVVPAPEPDPQEEKFDKAWGDNLMARTWAALEAASKTGYAVLRFRADHQDLSSQDLASQLTKRLGKQLTAEAVRQTLHRARKQFALL